MARNRRRGATRLGGPVALAIGAGMAVVHAAAPGHASSTSKKDPAGDHIGESSSLDLAGGTLRTKGKQKIQLTFRLHNPVSLDDFAVPGSILTAEFLVGPRAGRAVKIQAVDGVLAPFLCTYRLDENADPRDLVGCKPVKVTQVDPKTFRVQLKRKQLMHGAKVVRWRAAAYVPTPQGAGSYDPLGADDNSFFTWRP